jgi:primosomal protein N'
LTDLIFDRGLTKRWDVVRPLIAETLAAGKGIICAVPDATHLDAVVPHLTEIGEVPVLLSHGSDKEDFERWNALREGRVQVAVGFISAVLAPARELGLVVIFEEDNPFYKHDQSPFYHARDAALLRAKLEGCRVVLVTSAPSLEAWHAVEEGRAQLKLLEDGLPPVKFLDLRNFKMKKDTFLSPALKHHIEWAGKEGRKVLLYIQAARGVAGVVDEVKAQFPDARVAGYDKASREFPADARVVVATQAVFRHRYQMKFDVVAVLDIDWEFHKSDYRAAHNAFALTQHFRQMAKEFVLLQTRHMEHELLHYLADDDIRKFYRKELALRKEMGFPPFKYLVALVVRSADPQLACDEAKRLYDSLVSRKSESVEIHEPQQDRSAIVRGKFRWCVMAQARPLKTVMELVKDVKRTFRGKRDTVVTVNVNP